MPNLRFLPWVASAFAFGVAACSGAPTVDVPAIPDLPDGATCDDGQTRPCEQANDLGTCPGVETCENGIWGECDAPAAERETCNGEDDDCNGDTDEGSVTGSTECTLEGSLCPGRLECQGKDGIVCVGAAPTAETCNLVDDDCNGTADDPFIDGEGLYSVDAEHCGSCGVSCAEAIPLAIETECQATPSGPRCVALSCPEGTRLAPEGVGCIVLNTKLCEVCTTAAEGCSTSVGDACLDYGGGDRYCGRDCTEDSLFGVACPRGFVCVEGQCRLLGTQVCTCGPGDLFDKPCDFTSAAAPGQICSGLKTCDHGAFGECLAVAEQCNGADDDCDGSIDEDFVDGATGEYSVDPRHCGACGVSCDVLFGNPKTHAAGACDASGGAPVCALGCEPGFGDANGDAADGCECETLGDADDLPDPDGLDSNCDGIDGDVSRAVFVSKTGSDDAPGTREEPARTIGHGIEIATQAGRDHVYVAEGIYLESVVLSNGVSVYGSYAPDFSARDALSDTTVVTGASPTAAAPGAVNAVSITEATVVDGLTVAASSQSTSAGNSYALYVSDSGSVLEIAHNRILAGKGTTAAKGDDGDDAESATADPEPGAGAQVPATGTQCATETRPGGAGATWSCKVRGTSSKDATSGGDGGSAVCPIANQGAESGTDGIPSAASGPGGNGGYDSLLVDLNLGTDHCAVRVPLSPPAPADATEEGLPGQDGSNGSHGPVALACLAGRGSVAAGEWTPAMGGRGGDGHSGGGGGGGGAAGGVQVNPPYSLCTEGNGIYKEALGGGGGGGGAGGCGGFGGEAGGSGGGSFGVFVVFSGAPTSLPSIHDNAIERGFGGAGGAGGAGGKGGLGSAGALGGIAPDTTGDSDALFVFIEPAGRGGDGGSGGFGAGGAGGCGGPSVGVWFSNVAGLSTASIENDNSFPSTGSAGAGADGGPSAGPSGPKGADGLYVEVSK